VQSLLDRIPAGALEFVGVVVHAARLLELVLVTHAERFSGPPHNVELVIGVDEGAINESCRGGDVDVDLLEPAVGLVDLGEVIRFVEPVESSGGVLHRPPSARAMDLVAHPVERDYVVLAHRLDGGLPPSIGRSIVFECSNVD
jgi:hypothetical protein